MKEARGDGPEEPLEDTATPDDFANAIDLEEIYASIQEIFKQAKAGLDKTQDTGSEEPHRDTTAQDGSLLTAIWKKSTTRSRKSSN